MILAHFLVVHGNILKTIQKFGVKDIYFEVNMGWNTGDKFNVPKFRAPTITIRSITEGMK